MAAEFHNCPHRDFEFNEKQPTNAKCASRESPRYVCTRAYGFEYRPMRPPYSFSFFFTNFPLFFARSCLSTMNGQHIVFNFSCFINNVFIIISNYKYIPPLQISSANLTFLFFSNYLLLLFSQTYPFTHVFRFCFFSLTAPIIAHCFSYVTVHST